MKLLLVAFSLVCCLFGSAGARAEAQALIMAISAYQGAVPALKGVTFDVANAKSIARRMGVREDNIMLYRDGQLTLAGIRKAFDDFYDRLQPNDQAFVYFSGHGGRWFVQAEDRCAESIVAVDGEHLIDSEMESRLKKLSQKAEKVIMFFDSCHSGGVTTRALGPAKFVPKTWPGAMTCEKPVNVLTRNISVAAKTSGSGGNNYVVIASSRDNEVSFDMPEHGGVATSAWTECINGAAVDKDRSGGLSAAEIRDCTQGKINSAMSGAQGFLPHNVTITGNTNAILAFAQPAAAAVAATVLVPPPLPAIAPAAPSSQPQQAAKPPAQGTKPPAQATKPPAQGTKPPPAPAVASTQGASSQPAATQTPASQPASTQPASVQSAAQQAAASGPASPLATLDDIYNRRDDRRSVTFKTAKPRFKIGKDKVEFSVSSTHPGFVYLLMVGSDGKAFDMLFPNSLDKDHYIKAGETLALPRTSWELLSQGPAGKNHLLVMVADAQRDFSKAGLKPAGPFSMISANMTAAKDIQMVSVTSSSAGSSDCQDTSAKRNLVVQQSCSNAYGAAMTVVEEID